MNLPDGMAEHLERGHPYPRAFVTVSGAHLYGFPSADSDVDLRGVHLLPLTEIVGLETGRETVTWTWHHNGVEADLVTHDLAKFCRMLLNRNGYVLEQVASPLVVASSPVHEELLALLPDLVTSAHAHHYLGFGRNQWALFEKTGRLKPLLYTFRVLHALARDVATLTRRLEEERDRSPLPAQPTAHRALHALVVRTRLPR